MAAPTPLTRLAEGYGGEMEVVANRMALWRSAGRGQGRRHVEIPPPL